MELVTQCPVCKNNEFSPFLVCRDYLISQQDFAIQQCDACGFRLTNPRPDEAVIGDYYKSNQYISHNDSGGGPINLTYRAVRNYTLQSKLKLINKLKSEKGRLLDVGCGTGSFLGICKANGWDVMGVEPDPNARAVATKKLLTEIGPELSSLAEERPFDVISLWHVLEHISNLDQAIAQLYKLLTEEGNLLIAVPNSDSYDATYFGNHWAAYDVPRHLYHFTPSTIKSLFKRYGFQLVEQRPMLFDAFYIAMLSTRYQTGETNYLKSVQVGLTSNAKSKRTGNASSIMYLFKKVC